MTTYKKNYIGNGKPTKIKPELGIISVTLHMDKVEPFIYKDKDGNRYLTFEVAAKDPAKNGGKDEFGRTHNVYVITKESGEMETEPDPEPQPEKKNGKGKKGA